MKRNAFGQPKPANAAEIGEALDELLIDPSTVMVIVDQEDDGYYAEILGDDDKSFQVGPFDDPDSLGAALEKNGIENF